jgi:hypothetical protein
MYLGDRIAGRRLAGELIDDEAFQSQSDFWVITAAILGWVSQEWRLWT